VHINLDVDAGSGSSDRTPTNSTSIARQSDNVVIDAMRMNSEIAKSVVDRFLAPMFFVPVHRDRGTDGKIVFLRERVPRSTKMAHHAIGDVLAILFRELLRVHRLRRRYRWPTPNNGDTDHERSSRITRSQTRFVRYTSRTVITRPP